MTTPRLRLLFALSIPLFVAHGLEEIFTGFYDVDAWDAALFAPFAALGAHGAMFVAFQLMFWLLLLVSFLMLLGERWRFRLLAVLGAVYVFEVHHLVKAFVAGGYYPGVITAPFFLVLAYFFWREWLRARRAASPVHGG